MFYTHEFWTGLFLSNRLPIHIMKEQPRERTYFSLVSATCMMHVRCKILCFPWQDFSAFTFILWAIPYSSSVSPPSYIKLASQFLLLKPKNSNCCELRSSHNKGKFEEEPFHRRKNLSSLLRYSLGFHKTNLVACLALVHIYQCTLL